MTNKEKLYFKRLLNEWLNKLTSKINVMTPSESQEQHPEVIERASYRTAILQFACKSAIII